MLCKDMSQVLSGGIVLSLVFFVGLGCLLRVDSLRHLHFAIVRPTLHK